MTCLLKAGRVRRLQGRHKPARDDLGLARMKVAGIEKEVAPLGLVVAHDDRRIAGGKRRGEAARR